MEREANGGLRNRYHSMRNGEGSSDCAEDQSSLINSVHLSLIVTNTILTVIRVLKPSFSIHSLQIYCTEFTSPRCHTSWAWTEKRDPTNTMAIVVFMGVPESIGRVQVTNFH